MRIDSKKGIDVEERDFVKGAKVKLCKAFSYLQVATSHGGGIIFLFSGPHCAETRTG
jgi:hypothetical protein